MLAHLHLFRSFRMAIVGEESRGRCHGRLNETRQRRGNAGLAAGRARSLKDP